MNLEKIKNYNHWLLAILGTILGLFGVVGLIALIFSLISSITPNHVDKQDYSLLSGSGNVEHKSETTGKQTISMEMPVLIDTLNSIYYIPVTQKNLKNLDAITDNIKTLLDISTDYSYEKDYRSTYSYDFQATNNVVIYNQPKNESANIFNKRVIIGNIYSQTQAGDIFLVCKAVNYTLDKDGYAKLSKYNSLFVYSVRTKKLNEISLTEANILSYEFVAEKKKILISIGHDSNKDGYYDNGTEPSTIQEYTIETEKLAPIVDKEIATKMQKLL